MVVPMSDRIGMEALQKAVEEIGSQALVGEACGVRQSAISECLRNGKRVPAEWCLPIEEASKGKVTRHDLRPDLWPAADLPPSSRQDTGSLARAG
jgi:DNA-binding transcriptional regulator YdaS (Cro superfamily)